jgi:hypothetical protein
MAKSNVDVAVGRFINIRMNENKLERDNRKLDVMLAELSNDEMNEYVKRTMKLIDAWDYPSKVEEK